MENYSGQGIGTLEKLKNVCMLANVPILACMGFVD